MNIEEIKKRLMKMKALANAGIGGERANAEKLLVELAAILIGERVELVDDRRAC